MTWILHESGAFSCKALKGEAIVWLLRAFNNATDGSLRVEIDEIKKGHHIICLYHLGKMNICKNLLKLAYTVYLKKLHQFSCKIQV